ncbi:helix-turn-helix transcriptional regulator [Actinomadura verrucosospora]|uniref:XRE family transcriptional regulator n=1 Tax=Actinomadura verrucosospora TaxID=46165 RepID=A0A7D3ZR00_ACTVE|nr:helix-turn-helix transcriptional regulator [Actinomadura verrucosospora]QKG27001.1 XRE family transcriptional regulator [Actinomadura verrucosospora]
MNDTIGTAIRLRRRALGITQAGLARLAGLDQPAVSRLESGSRLPPLPVLERVADVLGLRLTIALEPVTAPQGAPRSPGRR